MQNTVNIIVIGYALGDIEKVCLDSIVEFTDYPYLLTYYDNSKNEYTLTEIWNELVSVSPCPYICLLNNDTRVTPNWLTYMVDTLETQGVCGFVGPSTNSCHSPQKTINTLEKARQHKGEAVEMDDPISGFCLLFLKSIWDKLGGFDKQYKHYGQESDFIDRAKQLGWAAYWRKDAFVHHIGEASVKASGIDAAKARAEAKQIYWSTREK
jgi:GT2 family glycosyltransferase